MSRSVTNTHQIPYKRVKIYPTTTTVLTNSTYMGVKSSKSLYDSLIQGHVASIQPQISYILNELGNQHVNIFIHAYNNAKQVKMIKGVNRYFQDSSHCDFWFLFSHEADQKQSPKRLRWKQNCPYYKYIRHSSIKYLNQWV